MALKRRVEPVVSAIDRASFRRRLAKKRVEPARGKPELNYAGAIQSCGQSFAIGGRVKLLTLSAIYPDREAGFNILYLVSSALPPFAGDLARWARDHGVRVVVNQNGVASPAWAGRRFDAINRPLVAVLDQADYIIFQSKFCRLGAQRYLHCPDVPFEILYNPVDTSIFQPARRTDSPIWRLLAAGTSHARYRVRSVLDAVAELKKRGRAVHLTIAGAMTWRGAEADFSRDVAASGIESDITWRGGFSRDEAPVLYQQADILIHTKYNDPSPTVPIEAMACGVPVVASGSGGVPELVTDGSGVLVDLPLSWEENLVPSAVELADGVETVMDDHESYRDAARRVAVTRFDARDWIEAHTRVFESLVGASSHARVDSPGDVDAAD